MAIGFGALAPGMAMGASWKPDGGNRVPAPDGTYVGHVTITVDANGTLVHLTTAGGGPNGQDGVLTARKDEFTPDEWMDVMEAVEQNDRDNRVRIQNGEVVGVGTGKPFPR